MWLLIGCMVQVTSEGRFLRQPKTDGVGWGYTIRKTRKSIKLSWPRNKNTIMSRLLAKFSISCRLQFVTYNFVNGCYVKIFCRRICSSKPCLFLDISVKYWWDLLWEVLISCLGKSEWFGLNVLTIACNSIVVWTCACPTREFDSCLLLQWNLFWLDCKAVTTGQWPEWCSY